MKYLLGTLLLVSQFSFADVISLSEEGKTGRFCPGNEISYDMPNGRQYVERMLVSAEGVRNDGFIKVYADNELVFNIGVPGYDPDYSFRIKRPVSNITMKFERTCSRVLEAKIFAPGSSPSNYKNYSPQTMFSDSWGAELLEITRSLSSDLQYEHDFMNYLWPEVLLPLKKIALLQGASAGVRDEQSSVTALKSLKMAKIINEQQVLMDRLLFSGQFDYVISDLLTIKEDIMERYDVNQDEIDAQIIELEEELGLGE